MKFAFCLLAIGCTLAGSAQSTVDVTNGEANAARFFQTVSGQPIGVPKFTRLVSGTPYFIDRWIKGSVVSANEAEYKDIDLKLNLLDNNVLYRDEKGNELVSATPFKEVILVDGGTHTNFRFVHSSTLGVTAQPVKAGWFLWLQSGNASLYKQFRKKLIEEKPYGSATTEQKIATYEDHFIVYNGALMQVKKIRDLPSILANKKSELEAFLKTRDKKDDPLDDRLAALVAYYNTLQ